MYHNQKTHKAQHGGYRKKPTRQESIACFNFQNVGSDVVVLLGTPGFGTPRLGTPVGEQLKINFDGTEER